MKRILLFFGLLFLANILIGQTTQKDTVNVKPFEDLTLVTDGTVDTSDQFLMYDISAGLFSYRLSLGELLKKAIDVPNIVGSSQIVNGSILDTDISGSAGIGLNKLATTAAGRLLLTDSGGAGTWVSGTPGYGLTISGISMLVDTSSASGLVSKSRLTNALDDVIATGGIWEQENSNTLASNNTTDNYHEGEIGIGDFSSNLIAAPIHVYATDARIRLSDSTSTDTTAIAYVEYFRNYNTTNMGRVGFLSNTDQHLTIENSLAGGKILFETEGTVKAEILPSGQLSLKSYGDTLFTGTAVKYLAVTDDGLVIEADGGISISEGTPENSTTPASANGSLLYDSNNIYIKTSAGWAKTALTILSDAPTLSYSSDLLLYTYQNVGFSSSVWSDQSGSDNDITQPTTTNQPATDVSGAPDFDGVDNYMIVPDLWSAATDSSYTVFVVFDLDVSTAAQRVIAYSSDTNNNNWALQINNVDGSNYSTQYFTYDQGGLINLTNLDTAAINTNVLMTIAASENTSIEVRQNGTQVATNAITGPWGYTDTSTGFNIGVNGNADVGFMNGQIRLIAIYNRKLSGAEISTVEGEINTALSIY